MSKDNTKTCLVCDASIQSIRNNFAIFTNAVTASEKKLVHFLSCVLKTDLNESSVHSVVICKKCYRTCNEIDEIQERVKDLSRDLVETYEKTLRKLNEGILECNESDDDTKPKANDGETFEPKKPVPVKKISKPPSRSAKTKVTTSLKTAQPDTRTIITVKMVDLSDPDINLETIKVTEEESSNLDLYIDTKEDNDDSSLDLGEDRMEEILEADLKEGEMPLKLEVREEKIEKRGRGRPRKKPKILEEEERKITPEMVMQKQEHDEYRCLLCESLEKCNAKDIIGHLRTVHDIKLFICDMCGKEYMNRTEFHVHLDEHMSQQEAGEYQCEVCNRIFNSLRVFRVHKKTHFKQLKSYFCEFCGKRFASRQLIEDHHLSSHIGVGEKPYQCAQCPKAFSTKYYLTAHLKTHGERARPYPCGNCGKRFYTQQNMVQHERTHYALKDYICSECGKAFSTARNLETHLAIHTGNRPFICRVCGKAFTRKAEKQDHERTHTGERPYQCEFCGAQFSQRSNLLSHKRATHFNDRRYPCDSCDKAFKRRRLLDYHIKAVHTGERPYQCDVCNNTFIYPEHYKKHLRIHTGEKPYKCEVCGKAFNSRDNRNAHRFVHSDKKPYECVVCGAGFMRKPLLYAHMAYQGHETDTIVVNQPQLMTKDNVNDTEERLSITEEDVKLVPISSPKQDEDSQGSTLSDVPVEHLVMDDNGQVAIKSSIVVDSEIRNIATMEQDMDNVVTLQDVNMDAGMLESGVNIVHDSTILETEDGPVHLVQIRLPDERGEMRDLTWVNIIDSEVMLPAT